MEGADVRDPLPALVAMVQPELPGMGEPSKKGGARAPMGPRGRARDAWLVAWKLLPEEIRSALLAAQTACARVKHRLAFDLRHGNARVHKLPAEQQDPPARSRHAAGDVRELLVPAGFVYSARPVTRRVRGGGTWKGEAGQYLWTNPTPPAAKAKPARKSRAKKNSAPAEPTPRPADALAARVVAATQAGDAWAALDAWNEAVASNRAGGLTLKDLEALRSGVTWAVRAVARADEAAPVAARSSGLTVLVTLDRDRLWRVCWWGDTRKRAKEAWASLQIEVDGGQWIQVARFERAEHGAPQVLTGSYPEKMGEPPAKKKRGEKATPPAAPAVEEPAPAQAPSAPAEEPVAEASAAPAPEAYGYILSVPLADFDRVVAATGPSRDDVDPYAPTEDGRVAWDRDSVAGAALSDLVHAGPDMDALRAMFRDHGVPFEERPVQAPQPREGWVHFTIPYGLKQKLVDLLTHPLGPRHNEWVGYGYLNVYELKLAEDRIPLGPVELGTVADAIRAHAAKHKIDLQEHPALAFPCGRCTQPCWELDCGGFCEPCAQADFDARTEREAVAAKAAKKEAQRAARAAKKAEAKTSVEPPVGTPDPEYVVLTAPISALASHLDEIAHPLGFRYTELSWGTRFWFSLPRIAGRVPFAPMTLPQAKEAQEVAKRLKVELQEHPAIGFVCRGCTHQTWAVDEAGRCAECVRRASEKPRGRKAKARA